MEQHIKALGVLNIIWGSLGALVGVIILMITGGAYAIVGVVTRSEPGAAIALPVIAVIGGAISLLLLVLSAPSIIAGIALLYLKPWARILAIIVSALHLLNIPFGTALGSYGLWVLLSRRSLDYFTPDAVMSPPSA